MDNLIPHLAVDPTHQNKGFCHVPGVGVPPPQHGMQGDLDREDGYAADDDEDITEVKCLKAQHNAQKAKDKPHTTHLKVWVEQSLHALNIYLLDNSSASLKECVHKHMKYVLLKVKSTKVLPSRYPPHTAEEIKTYNNGDAPPINRDNFQPDFTLSWKSTDYNIDAHFFCIEEFIREAKGGLYSEPLLPSHFLTFDIVAKTINNHMDYLH